MSSRGWEGITHGDLAKRGLTHGTVQRAVGLKPSKYRNVKTTIDGQVFDSKREADYWIGLKAREHAGEITNLARQVRFNLTCPNRHQKQPIDDEWNETVCVYVADFEYFDRDRQQHVVDAKGLKTAIYRLKKKWMALEHGIEIEEV